MRKSVSVVCLEFAVDVTRRDVQAPSCSRIKRRRDACSPTANGRISAPVRL